MALRFPLQIIPAQDTLPQSTRTMANTAILKGNAAGLGISGLPLTLNPGQVYQSVHSYYAVGYDHFSLMLTGEQLKVLMVLVSPIDGVTEIIQVDMGTTAGGGGSEVIEKSIPGVYAFHLKFFPVANEEASLDAILGLTMSKL